MIDTKQELLLAYKIDLFISTGWWLDFIIRPMILAGFMLGKKLQFW